MVSSKSALFLHLHYSLVLFLYRAYFFILRLNCTALLFIWTDLDKRAELIFQVLNQLERFLKQPWNLLFKSILSSLLFHNVRHRSDKNRY